SSPSAPIGVMTQGSPAARLSITLPLTPAPKRSGASELRNFRFGRLPGQSGAKPQPDVIGAPAPVLGLQDRAQQLGGVAPRHGVVGFRHRPGERPRRTRQATARYRSSARSGAAGWRSPRP